MTLLAADQASDDAYGRQDRPLTIRRGAGQATVVRTGR
jgi:hypothetical protein